MFDYEESRLTPVEMLDMEARDPGRVKQYERGIITGGELDCLFYHGVLPEYLPNLQ